MFWMFYFDGISMIGRFVFENWKLDRCVFLGIYYMYNLFYS